MLKKNVALIAGTQPARVYLENQLKEYISEVATINSYSLEEGLEDLGEIDLLVLSSETIYEKLGEGPVLDGRFEVVVARRTVNYDFVDKIVLLPKGLDVIFVNDSERTTVESINTLKRLGIDHINYVAYYPGISPVPKGIDICITAGEAEKVPDGMKKVYDIGTRIIDFSTIAEIWTKLGALDGGAGNFSDKYLKKLINVSKRLAKSNKETSKLNEGLNYVIEGINDGILVYDQNGTVSLFNENLKKMLKVSGRGDVFQKHVNDVIHNKTLLDFLMGEDFERSEIFDIDGFEILVKKMLIEKNNSFIAVFKGVRQTIEENYRIRKELIKKGFYAKYTFDDIIGCSPEMQKTKELCSRLAKSELTILIEGESGTGKELVASAIHNASKRRDGPFLAVNFSALPEELIESELFGYEEGAFTGASKGGKVGLFEQADGGSIFLDEIGDVSIKMQARLLRVLQEKEVMRIGAEKINAVDVRIIAATNKDLFKMMSEKKFREDLYHRIKVGHVKIPPLRKRKGDIEELARHFINEQTGEKDIVLPEVIERLVEHEWHGNVRELKNSISYMMAVRSSEVIGVDDLPENIIYNEGEHERCDESGMAVGSANPIGGVTDEEAAIMSAIARLQIEFQTVGRVRISNYLKAKGVILSENQIRNRLDKLEARGLVSKGKGKKGTLLTAKGKRALNISAC